jgi:chloride channel protein, CIC family
LGWLIGLLLPGDHGFWALVGMAAMMGGTMRAPLTGTMFAVELTENMDVMLPVFAASIMAYGVTVLLLKRSILTERLARRGQHITREYAFDPFELTLASEVMTSPVDTLPGSLPVNEAVSFFTSGEQRHRMYPIVDAGGVLLGAVTRADALRWRREGTPNASTLFDVVSDVSIPTAFPDETIGTVADRMVTDELGRVPVITRETRRLVGLIARKDLLRVRAAAVALEREREAFYFRWGGTRRKTARMAVGQPSSGPGV